MVFAQEPHLFEWGAEDDISWEIVVFNYGGVAYIYNYHVMRSIHILTH